MTEGHDLPPRNAGHRSNDKRVQEWRKTCDRQPGEEPSPSGVHTMGSMPKPWPGEEDGRDRETDECNPARGEVNTATDTRGLRPVLFGKDCNGEEPENPQCQGDGSAGSPPRELLVYNCYE